MRTVLRILGILLIFVFGFFTGAVLTHTGIEKKAQEIMLGGPTSIMEVVVKRLDRDLGLDPAQKRKLQTIVDDAHIKLRQSNAKIRPEIVATLSEAEQRVRAMLYPNQIQKFDQIINRSREKWKAMEKDQEKRTPPPGTPPLGTPVGQTIPPKESPPKETPKSP